MHNVPLNSKQEHKEQALKDSKSYSTLVEKHTACDDSYGRVR